MIQKNHWPLRSPNLNKLQVSPGQRCTKPFLNLNLKSIYKAPVSGAESEALGYRYARRHIANKSVLRLDLKVPMLLAVLVVTDNEFQIVGAALVKQ